MAHYSSGRHEPSGDQSLLEEMLFTFFGEQDIIKEQEQPAIDEAPEDNDLQKILWSDTEAQQEVEDEENVTAIEKENSDEDAQTIEFLYRRSDLFYETPKDDDLNGGSSTVLHTESLTFPPKRTRFVQAHNEEYRQLMEEFMLIKCCSKEIMDYLEETKDFLNRYIEVKNEPGIDTMSTVQGWTLVMREAVVISFSATNKDRKRRKFLEMFLQTTIKTLENSFKQLHGDMGNVVKAYQKVEKEMMSLVKKSLQIFANNLESARLYEKTSSGYEFFLHRSDDESAVSLHGQEKVEKVNQKIVDVLDPNQALTVRCSVDGITLRSGKPGSTWHKFQSLDQDADKQVFMKIFANELCHIGLIAGSNLKLVKDLLEVGKISKKVVKESIFRSISHCKKILEKSKRSLHFLPKEEVVLLYSLNSMTAAFELIKPLLTELVMSSEKMFHSINELCKLRKILKGGDGKARRLPLQRHSRFELEIANTNVNIELILNRYPNLYDAKQLRDKIFQNVLTGDTVPEDIFVEEPKLETLYKCPSQVFSSPSTQEVISLIRKLIVEKATTSTHPNPAHLLFADFEPEYNQMATETVETRQITSEALALCSDPIKNFYSATNELSIIKNKIVDYLVSAVENLLFPETCSENLTNELPDHVPTFFWIQLICKAIHIWDFHALPMQLQRHFCAVYQASLKWMNTLNDKLAELSALYDQFHEEFQHYCNGIEDAHKFSTWIKKKFNFNPPDIIISKWKQDVLEQSKSAINSPPLETSTSTTPSLEIDFSAFDMDLVKIDPADASRTILLTLNKASNSIQVGIVSILFTYFDQIISRVVVNLNSAKSTFQHQMSMKPLRNAIAVKWKGTLPPFNRLEDIVLALSFETLHSNMKEMQTYLELVGKALSQFQKMFQMVQLHLEDRAIITSSYGSGDATNPRLRKRLSKKRLKDEMDQHRNHDIFLNETIQLLRTSVKAMPNNFTIGDGTVKHSLLHWVKLAEKDLHGFRDFRSQQHINLKRKRSSKRNSQRVIASKSEQRDLYINQSESDIINCPIDFEEAMAHTTTGKAFFPDPIQFNANIECWRSVCFKMLSAALEKFREITTTRISNTRRIICQPCKSIHNTVELKSSSLQEVPPAISAEDSTCVETKNEDFAETSQPKSTPVIESLPPESKDKPLPPDDDSEYRVGFSEGVCSILCFITSQLTPRDRTFVSFQDLRALKNKFFAVTSVLEKFQKDLDVMEHTLINSLGSAMAAVEYKNFPEHLSHAIHQNNSTFNNQDLDEVVSKLPVTNSASTTQNDEMKDVHNAESNLHGITAKEGSIELHWNSLDKQTLLCRNKGESAWLDFRQLHITGQLRILHILIDDLIDEFEEAREMLKEAKLDLSCAKKLLEKTWKGIGKDMKRGRIPDSGILVLIKLYRFQIETAIVDSNYIKRATREVRFLLSQSVHKARVWANEDNPEHFLFNSPDSDKNYILTLDNLSLTLTLRTSTVPSSKNCWLVKDDTKANEEEGTDKIPDQIETSNQNFLDIKKAVRVKSSTILEIAEDMKLPTREVSLQQSMKMLNPRSPQTVKPIAERTVTVSDDSDFNSTALSIEKLLLCEIERSIAILKFPNCVLPQSFVEGVDNGGFVIPNIVGVAAAFAAVTMRIRSYKDIVPLQRNYLTDRIRNVQVKLNKIQSHNFGMCEQLIEESKKIRKNVVELDSNFRAKFCFDGEFPPLENVSFGPSHPNYGITPLEFIEGLAASISGYVWTIMIGVPELGTVIRDNKSLESYAVVNLPMSTKLEILLSLIHFIEKLTEHMYSSMESTKKDIASAKRFLKSHAKLIKTRTKKYFRIGSKPANNPKNNNSVMSKWEIEEYLQGFARISHACIKSDEILSQINAILSDASEILQQVFLYISLRFKVEPPGGLPSVSPNEILARSQAWQAVDVITGLVQPPSDVPPPTILKRNMKENQLRENAALKYKAAMEHKILELEISFDHFCNKHHCAVDVPMMLFPRAPSEEECCCSDSEEL